MYRWRLQKKVQGCLLLGIFFPLFASGQNVSGGPKALSFEVASVKQAEGADAVQITPRRSGNRLTYVSRLDMIVCDAYHVQPFQIRGQSLEALYSIEAVFSGPASDAEIREMLQTLLGDRFRFAAHREFKELTGYALMADEKGAKLKPAEDRPIILDGRAIPSGVGLWGSVTGPRLIGRNASMPQLAESLSLVLHTPVIDRTGLAGRFDFDVPYTTSRPEQSDAGDMQGQSLFGSIHTELGLSVVKSNKVPVQILVVDHIEKPTEN